MAKKKISGGIPSRYLFRHSPDVVDKFDAPDLHTSYYPLPGIDFHNNPDLARYVEQYGMAPDKLFQQGMVAPPLGSNESGLRHYAVEFKGDPNRILNLDVPLKSQTPEVQRSLLRLGIDNDASFSHRVNPAGQAYPDPNPLSVTEMLWGHGLIGEAMDRYIRDDSLLRRGEFLAEKDRAGTFDDFARAVATGAGEGQLPAFLLDLKSGAAPRLIEDLNRVGIHGAAKIGPGWGAGTAFAPSGASNFKSLLDDAEQARRSGDVLAAQKMEADAFGRMEEFRQRGGVNPFMQQAPTGGTKEYKIFDPSLVEITRIASLLGMPAAALSGAASQQADPTDLRGSLLTQ